MTAVSKQMRDAAGTLAVRAEMDDLTAQDGAELARHMSGWADRVETMELWQWVRPAQARTVTLDERIARLFGGA